ncbi:COP1-interacting protein 7 isoform X1 [Vigna radiata var. radiata]|uniref:COP1-interacting protein 7 isoform X1 n=2 Tax=Vigna radiata var. radiata TaxID=3916 RepID=A0A1S3V7H9_VIGRR|nr:COP1-interacting protein 7 isoform X1 [Vigna radiata var. radiata]
MNSSTRLDSVMFQLTPTRTRFDLVITVNGKKEKVASGLLNPFLSHLKAAQDQITKGGYSIVLVPGLDSDASWFTKGTIERFVRFVSTPEILERVYTIESEIAQIEEAIAIQGNNSVGMSFVEENQIKHVESTEGNFERTGRKTQQDTNEDKAIVLYKSDTQPLDTNGGTKSEGNPKVQLLKVLETRKSVLQKEQGMAFARAAAAGFDIDYMPALMAFAECFEASRLMDGCRNFISVWKRKHESGQWLEIEATEVTTNRADTCAINASGIVISASHTELDSESNGKTNSADRQPTAGYQDNVQCHFPNSGFSSWPVHSPPGALPMFQTYPVQGIPYYQSYPGNSPFVQPVSSPMEDSRLNANPNLNRRHSMDNGQYTASETMNEMAMDREGSLTGERPKKDGRSGRHRSGMVVIRNINYITKKERSSESGSCSDYSSETDEDKEVQESVKTSERRGSSDKSLKRLNLSYKEVTDSGKDADGGQWLAFQNCLLRGVGEDRHDVDQDKFDEVRRKKFIAGNDPIDFTERNMHEVQGSGALDMQRNGNGLTHMLRSSSNDGFLLSRSSGQSVNGRSVDAMHSLEIDGRIGYRRGANDDFVNGLGYSSNKLERKLFHDNDDSYVVRVNDSGNLERNAIDMDSEFPNVHKKEENNSNYQPDELSLMPERRVEKGSMDHDRALDYEMQASGGGSLQDKKNKGLKPRSKMMDKDLKSNPTPNNSYLKKTVGPVRRGKTSKPSPLDEARARAERLRNYKADLQKMKKEKEEEEVRRLNALKMERQRRIAAKSNSMATKSSTPPQQTKKQIPTKLSPSSYKGSKFSDSEPGSSSPFQRFPIRTASVGSNDSSKAPKTSRLNTNKLSRSAPSLPESKREKGDGTTDTKASIARIRRLSEPKTSTIRHISSVSVKPRGARTSSITKATNETDIRKISAIVNHDKSKTTTLPELRIGTSKTSDIVQTGSLVKERTQKLNINLEDTLLKKNEFEISPIDDEDDNPIIEKTVVMLEREKPCAPNSNHGKAKEKTRILKGQYENDKVMEKTETVPSYVAIHTTVSVDTETSDNKSRVKPGSSKVIMNDIEKEPTKSSSIHITDKTYHSPHVRVSSLEDCSTQSSEYGKAPCASFDSASIGMETFRSRVSDSRNSTLEKIPEVIEKPQVKESSKGLRRLLKFGRKNHDSPPAAGRNSIDGSEANETGKNASPNEVHTLKNLISRDETPLSATSQKSSRSFSLLSPFRSNKGKKIMMS